MTREQGEQQTEEQGEEESSSWQRGRGRLNSISLPFLTSLHEVVDQVADYRV